MAIDRIEVAVIVEVAMIVEVAVILEVEARGARRREGTSKGLRVGRVVRKLRNAENRKFRALPFVHHVVSHSFFSLDRSATHASSIT